MQIFDATQYQPQQGMPAHPPGMFDFQVSNTFIRETKDKEGAQFVVELTSPAGRIANGYNIFNKSGKAVEIAQKQLSALCHATGVFKLSFPDNQDGTPNMQMAGAELRGARGRMEVVPQKNKDGTENGYMEVVRVFDTAGNEPGKGGSAAPQPQQPNQNPAPQANWQQPPQGGNGASPPAWMR